MAFVFNADEVFEMAEQIERNGAAFYRLATMLDKVMSAYEVNDLVLIKRLEDIHSDNPNDMQQYVTYHPEEP